MRKSLLVAVLLLTISLAVPIRPAWAQSGLSGLLSQVADTPAARTVIWYGALGDLAATLNVSVGNLNDLNALDTTIRRTYLLETGTQIYFSGYSGLADAAGWEQRYGINSFAISRELTIGTGKDRYGILQGTFDANAINGALGALGYQAAAEAGATIYRSTDANAPLPAVAVKSDGLLIAQGDQIAGLLAPATVISADASYAALASVLESGSTTPGSLISAVIYVSLRWQTTLLGDRAGVRGCRGGWSGSGRAATALRLVYLAASVWIAAVSRLGDAGDNAASSRCFRRRSGDERAGRHPMGGDDG
jgi:hypothetical protein